MEWNNCNYKMPQTHEPVLCWGSLDGEEKVFAGCWDNAKNCTDWYCFPIDWCSCCRNPETKVFSWMPYPVLEKKMKSEN